jgi:hypothetical protein
MPGKRDESGDVFKPGHSEQGGESRLSARRANFCEQLNGEGYLTAFALKIRFVEFQQTPNSRKRRKHWTPPPPALVVPIPIARLSRNRRHAFVTEHNPQRVEKFLL